jgi:hypothetical protein
MKNLKIFVLLLTAFSCNSNNIESLEVYYYQPGVSTPSTTFCNSYLFVETYSDVRYKKINDRSFLTEFENFLDDFKPSNEFAINSRVFTLINYKDGNIDTLCVGEYRDICLNGEVKIHNQEFHDLIMNKIDFYDKKLYDSIYKVNSKYKK